MRGLGKDNAERVGLHLVMAGRLLDVDPETAYLHAQAAVRRAGRIDVVREAAGLTAYRTGRFAEALRELRTVRRLNGSSEHLPLMADAERGLGRPERAIALAATPEAETLDASGRTELAIVVSGARSDLGEHDAALAVLDKIPADEAPGDLGLRVLQARAIALEAAGRDDEAAAVLADVDPAALARATGAEAPEEDVIVYDVYDEEADPGDTVDEDAADDHAADPGAVDGGPPDEDASHEDPVRADGAAVGADEAPPAGTGHSAEIPADLPEPSDAEVEAEVAEILAEAGIDDDIDDVTEGDTAGDSAADVTGGRTDDADTNAEADDADTAHVTGDRPGDETGTAQGPAA
ncbi:hypothetical protein [Myceligenerans xiligouense]|nr:hypothetical protein [Myceligenerans xiligouense]